MACTCKRCFSQKHTADISLWTIRTSVESELRKRTGLARAVKGFSSSGIDSSRSRSSTGSLRRRKSLRLIIHYGSSGIDGRRCWEGATCDI